MSIPRRLAGACMVILGVVAGCGVDTYQSRYEETRRYYAYLDKLNHVLGSPWSGQGVTLRVPKQFQLLPAPAPPKEPPPKEKDKDKDKDKDQDKDATPAPPERDPRQPTFAPIDLPGLQGAWRASLNLAANEGRAPGYLYVLSNYKLIAEGEPKAKEADFNRDVVETIAKAINQPVPDLDKVPIVQHPKRGVEAYVTPLKYKVVNPGLPATVEDKEYRIQIYAYAQAKPPSQISIVLIVPQDLSPSEKLEQAMDLCLETLVITPPPRRNQAVKGKTPTKGRGF